MLLCMDLGGTAVKLGLVDAQGHIHQRTEANVRSDGDATPILTAAMAAAKDFLTGTGVPVEGVGVSATGQVDSSTGVVIGTNGAIPHYEGVNIREAMEEAFGLPNDMTVSALARLPEVLTMEQVPEDEERLWEILSGALKEAAENLVHSREAEGEHLRQDLLEKLNYMEGLVAFIEERAPVILKEYRARLEDKVKELLDGSSIDEGRIAAEVVIYADKICVDEETVRLRSHIDSTKRELMQGGNVGRKLDFIAQEMNREANTILSKSSDPAISDQAIALKTEIEKIREQIQNIE